MKKTVLLTLLGVCSLPLFVQGQNSNNRELTDTEKIVGLSRLWEGVKNNFVFYDKLTFSWDSLYVASIPKVLETKDTYSYIKELERIVATVKDGHTYIISNNVNIAWEDRTTPAPFTTKLVDGKVFVDKVWSSDLLKRGVKQGVEVVSIYGVDVMKYGEEVLGQYVPSSTPQWLNYRIFNGYELTKGRRTVPVDVEFYDGKTKIAVSFNRNDDWDIQLREGQEENDFSTFKYTILKNNVGLLKVRNFMNSSFNSLFDSIYTEIQKSDCLIIDLRDNGGGNSGYADYILRHLSSTPIKTSSWSSRMYIPAHASWNYPAEWYQSPSGYLNPVNKEIYNKPVAVLINAGTFSSSEDFCVKFRGMKRGNIIGETSGGSTGNAVAISLIEGVAGAKICSKNDISPDGVAYVGIGVIPDIEVKETKKSFMEQKDIVLERALLELKKK